MKIIERRGSLVLALASKRESLVVKNSLHQDLTEYLESRQIYHNGDEFLVFSKPVYLLLKNYDSHSQRCSSIFFARKIISDCKPSICEVEIRRKSQAALLYARVIPIYAQPRFKTVILYESLSEIAIANYSECGNSGWITTEDVVEQCIKALPSIQDNGKMGVFYIVTRKGGSSRFIHCKEIPTGDENNWDQFVRVTYDEGSLRVKQLDDLLSNTEMASIIYFQSSKRRFLNKETRIPTVMRPSHPAIK